MNRKLFGKAKSFALMGAAILMAVGLAGCPAIDDGDLTIKADVAAAPGTVNGQVIRGDNQLPQQGVTVEVMDRGKFKSTKTDSDGRFRVSGLAVDSGGSNHLVVITDERSEGNGDNQIPTEADRLATASFRVQLNSVSAGENQPFQRDLGVIALGLGITINVQVTLTGGTLAPDGVVVVALSQGTNDNCVGDWTEQSSGFEHELAPIRQTTVSGVAAFGGLDICQDYLFVVVAQRINDVLHRSAVVDINDTAGIEGDNLVVVNVRTAIDNDDVAIISHNLGASPLFTAAANLPGFGQVRNQTENDVVAGGFNLGFSNNLGFGATNLTAGAAASDMIFIFNLPVELVASGTGDVDLRVQQNRLNDPDTDDDGNPDTGFNVAGNVTGVSGSLDATGTILTVQRPALTVNERYTIQGSVRNPTNGEVVTIAAAGGFSGIYINDETSGPVPTLDNRSGQLATTDTPSLVFLTFNEGVVGTYTLLSSVEDGTTTTVPGPAPVAINPGTTTLLASHFGDTTGGPDPNPCTACLNTDGVRVVQPIPGLTLDDDADSATLFISVRDVSGNLFQDTVTLDVN